MRFTLLIAAALCSAATSNAQAVWSEVTGLGTNIPVTRRESPGAADLSSMYVFGGQDAAGARLNDLWQFDGTAWTELTADGAVGSPPGRSQAAIAWDFNNSQLLVFGGNDGANTLGDTWTWDTTSGWVQQSPVTSPPALQFSQAAYDGFNDNILLFGGQDSSGVDSSDTWSWDGANWTQLAPATVPQARRQHGMAARLDQDDIVMCCGQNGSVKLGDTYVWDGTDWNLIATTVSPAPRVAMDMTYDEVRQVVVIPGGNNSSGNPIGNIAEFDGSDWVNLPKDPVILKRTRYFLAFVQSLGRSYMFGGQQVSAPLPTGTYQYYDPTLEPGTKFCPGDGIAPHSMCPCGNDNDGSMSGCDWVTSSGTAGGALAATGSASIAANDTYLVATNIENNFGIFFGANNQVNSGNGNPLNDGLRCAGGGLVRLIPPTMASGNQATTPLPVQTLDIGAGNGITRRYQYWFRTPSGPCGQMANLTNGYEIVWGL